MANSTITIEGENVDNVIIDETLGTIHIAGVNGAAIFVAEETPIIAVADPGPMGRPGTNKADIIVYIQSTMAGGENILEYEPSANQTIGNTAANSLAKAANAATSNTYINLLQNGTVIGNINFGAGQTIGTLDFNQFVLIPTDFFQLINANTADPTLGYLRITLSGTRA